MGELWSQASSIVLIQNALTKQHLFGRSWHPSFGTKFTRQLLHPIPLYKTVIRITIVWVSCGHKQASSIVLIQNDLTKQHLFGRSWHPSFRTKVNRQPLHPIPLYKTVITITIMWVSCGWKPAPLGWYKMPLQSSICSGACDTPRLGPSLLGNYCIQFHFTKQL